MSGDVVGCRRTRIKICGIARPEDARHAAALGADAIGLVFYARSPRAVNAEQARAVCRDLPPFLTRVGLFVDAPTGVVEQILSEVPLDMLQFHGDESPQDCRRFGLPFIKALRVRADFDVARAMASFEGAAAILLDSYQRSRQGGTGQCFDWSLIPAFRPRPIILAGGLTPDNVPAAIRAVRPYAVDVSSGVESAPGRKDQGMMTAFVRGVAHASD